MKFIHTIILLSAIAVLTLGQIAPPPPDAGSPPNAGSPHSHPHPPPHNSSSDQAHSPPTFTTIPLNLTMLNDPTIAADVNASLDAVNKSRPFKNGVPTLSAALLISASTGDKTYYFYLDSVDTNGKLHEFEAVVEVIQSHRNNTNTTHYHVVDVTP